MQYIPQQIHQLSLEIIDVKNGFYIFILFIKKSFYYFNFWNAFIF